MTTIQPGQPIFGHHKLGVFGVFDRFTPGLVVDVGAASGVFTWHALNTLPGCHAIAFEPLPGHWPGIQKRLAGMKVRIVKAAVADKPGTARFDIGNSNGAPFNGGFLTDSRDGTIEVPVTTLDDYVFERTFFMKIDVQGGELKVMKGAARAFEYGIDLMHIEVGPGDDDVAEFVLDRGYHVYDHHYMLVPRKGADLSFWRDLEPVKLTTGREALRAWPKSTPSDPASFFAMMAEQKKKVGSVFTDLIASRVSLN